MGFIIIVSESTLISTTRKGDTLKFSGNLETAALQSVSSWHTVPFSKDEMLVAFRMLAQFPSECNFVPTKLNSIISIML